ncbi:MAG: enoyl-CoA hydratase [Alphaproteobacteria bacterium]
MTDLVLKSAPAQGVVHLQMNRPQAYNALSRPLMSALIDELEIIRKDPSVAVVVISGAGKGFCAGHDLKEVKAIDNEAERRALFELCSTLMLAIRNLPIPVIAQAHGIATAAGCQLVASCDLAVSTLETRFATPGVNIGLFCSTPMVALSRNVNPKRAMEMLLTGDFISSDEALEFGLINRAVEASELESCVLEMAAKIASKSRKVVKIGKTAFYEQLEMPIEKAYAYTAGVMTGNLGEQDAQEGIGAFIGKRHPEWSHE